MGTGQEIRVDLPGLRQQMEQLQQQSQGLMLPAPAVYFSGQSETLMSFLELYHQFSAAVNKYSRILNADIGTALKSLEMLEETDMMLADEQKAEQGEMDK